jgi:hypothetical protein
MNCREHRPHRTVNRPFQFPKLRSPAWLLRKGIQLYIFFALTLLVSSGLQNNNYVRASDAVRLTVYDDSDTSFTSATALSADDYAIYVRESGIYPNDGVILPVFEALEARYAAASREFTVEYWFKLPSGYDSHGKELFDHHVPSNEGFWTAFLNGQLWAGIDTEPGQNDTAIHIIAHAGFNDGEWHHYALVRDLSASPDRLCLYLDGVGSCYVDGSKAEWASVSDDIRPPLNRDGDDSNNIPFYVIGARTSGANEIEAVIDELRISDVARYQGDFTLPTAPFALDYNTVMLLHFDEGSGNATYGRDRDNNPIEGTLVRDLGWYGRDATPLDPDDPTDAAWLSEMWTDGRFGSPAPPPSPTLTLQSPNGGELWLTGSQHPIKWTWTGTPPSYVNLSYSTDGFTVISHTIDLSIPNIGVYTWTTPITPSKTVRVRVTDADDPATYDDSKANFVLTNTIYSVYLPLTLKNEW